MSRSIKDRISTSFCTIAVVSAVTWLWLGVGYMTTNVHIPLWQVWTSFFVAVGATILANLFSDEERS